MCRPGKKQNECTTFRPACHFRSGWNEEDGVWGCTAIGYCSVVCPKQVDPGNAINMYKIKSTADYFIRFVARRGTGK